MQLAALLSEDRTKSRIPKFLALCFVVLLTTSCGRISDRAGEVPQDNMAVSDSSIRDGAPTLAGSQLATKPISGEPTSGISSAANLPDAASTVLNNIEIVPAGSSNQLRVALSGPAIYSLERTAPSEYSLKLEDLGINAEAPNSIVSKSKSGEIRSARIVTSSAPATFVKIFTKPHVELEAVNGEGGILVRASNVAHNDGDMMAQLAPEGTSEAAPTASDSSTSVSPAAAVPSTSVPAQVSDSSVQDTTEKKGDVAGSSTEEVAPAADEFAALLDEEQYSGRLISLDLQDTDIDNALRIIAEVSNLNIVTTEDVAGKVTLRLIDVPWDQALDVILKINALGKVQEGNVVRIAPLEKLRAERESLKQAKVAEEQLEELKVRYIRVSYAQAAELKPLVDTVLSERGTVVNDERTNQLIVKDTRVGLARVLELVKKLDLRTPQVLLETQIVESKRDFIRQLGSQFGFNFKQGPETGNATGWNFPNSVDGDLGGNNLGVLNQSSAGVMSLLFGSADGTRNLNLVLAAAETDGLAKVISRPSVATTNNRQATIKSVEKLRVKLPSNGSTVTVGQGAQGGSASTGTETIEAGIILEVTPQASPDYYILLDINAKSSSFTQRNVDDIPSEIERAATSTILVSSGQTFVMGGIYKIRENTVNSGIPFLKDVPVLGHMFRFSGVDDSDEELLFFITPRIIEGSFDDAAMKASL